MNSRPLMRLRLETAAREKIDALSIFPVIGGSFEGERLRGKVLAVGVGDIGPDGPLHVIEEIL